MIGVISGDNLGTSLSTFTDGGVGTLPGNANAGNATVIGGVNIATGNLVLQTTDDYVSGVGLPIDVIRTYNSQGATNGGADWSYSAQTQSAKLVGTLNASGSTVTLTHADGSQSIYTYNSAQSAYTSTSGTDAGSRIAAVGANFVRTDGQTQDTETYLQSTGKLMSSADTDGNSLTYTYSKTGALTSIKNAAGEGVTLDYNTKGYLIDVQTVASDGTQLVSTIRTSYTYDSKNRISTVTVQPNGDDAVTSFTTTYAYDSTSDRITSVKQSNGTVTAFTYVSVNGQYRVAKVTSGTVATTFGYNVSSNITSVTDAKGNITQYAYDAQGNLTQVTSPAPVSGGTSPVTQYAYDASGHVTSITDANGNKTAYTYDANENLLSSTDAIGNSVVNTWSTANQLLTQTVTTASSGTQSPAVALTTRYTYGSDGRRLFTIAPSGAVTHYVYAANGNLTSTVAYTSAVFNTSNLSASQSPTTQQLNTWLGGIDPSQAMRTDYAYDPRGLLSKETAYSKLLSSGAGDSSTASVTTYVYSPQGQLLSRTDASGDTVQYTYDGMGRQISATDALGNITTTSYDDYANSVVVTAAGGLSTTNVYNTEGLLLSSTQLDNNTYTQVSSSYQYDANGNLAMAVDADSDRTFYVYDALNRKVAQVDPNGEVTGFTYDAAGNVLSETRYANVVKIANLYTASTGKVKTLTLSLVTPTASSADSTTWNVYDADERLVATIDPAGTVTQTVYGAGLQVQEVIQYATTVQVANLTKPITLAGLHLQSSANDRTTRLFYSADGEKSGLLDADGYLTTYAYDDAGNLTGTTSYANPALVPQTGSNTLQNYVPVSSSNDIHAWSIYNAAGQVAGQIDGNGYLTEYVYNSDAELASMTTYATPVAYSAGQSLVSVRPAASANDQTTRYVYDADGRTSSVTDSRDLVTQYTYDADGHVISTVVGAGTSAERTTLDQYDQFGNLLAELSPAGAALLTGDQTDDEIAAIWAQYGTTFSYDAVGRKTSQVDPGGATTYFYYDLVGRLTDVVDPDGYVTQTTYDALGRATKRTRFAESISGYSLSGGPTADLQSILTNNASPGYDLVSTVTYNTDGTTAASTDALGTKTTFAYDAFGDVTSQSTVSTQNTQTKTNFSYDHDGQLTGTLVDPTGLAVTTSRQYDAFGRVVSITDGNGNTTSYKYDANGNEIASTDAAGNTVSIAYDDLNRVVANTDALGNKTTYSYAVDGSQLTVTTPDGISLVTKYDEFGEVTSVIDGNGNATTYRYDANGDRISTESASGTVTNTYDSDAHLLSTTDENGTVTQYTYDPDGRVLSRTVDPSGLALVTSYTYDSFGHAIRTTDPNGVVDVMTYDNDGEMLTQTVDQYDLALTTTWQYDGLGHVTSATDPNGTVTSYTYDALGRRVSQTVDPSGLDLITQYNYDAAGNLTSTVAPGGVRTMMVYDADNRLRYTIDANGDVSETDYDGDSRVIKSVQYAQPINIASLSNSPTLLSITTLVQASPTDVVQFRTFDANGQLVDTVDGTGGVTAYRYDGAGNVIEKIDYANRINVSGLVAGQPVPAPFADPAHDDDVKTIYDAAGRAIYSVDSTGAVVHQVYDANGNVVKRIAYATPIAANTPATAQAIAAAVAAVADSSRDEVVTQIFDAANRPILVVNGVGTLTQNTYDNDGHLIDSTTFAAPLPAGVDLAAALTTLKALKAQIGLPPSLSSSDTPLLVLLAENATIYGMPVTTLVGQAGAIMSALSMPATEQSLGAALQIIDLATGLVGTGPYDAGDTLQAAINALIPLVQTITTDGDFNAMPGAYWSTQYINNAMQTFASGFGASLYFPNDPANAPFQPGEDFATSVVAALQAMYNGMPDQPFQNQALPANTFPTDFGFGDPSVDRETTYTYDSAGRLTETLDPSGMASSYYYDADGRILQIVQTAGPQSGDIAPVFPGFPGLPGFGGDGFGGDGNGNGGQPQGITQRLTSYVYDAAGRQIFEIDPDGDVTQTQYDAAGNAVASVQYANPISIDGSLTGWYSPGDPEYKPGMTLAYVTSQLVPNAATDRVTSRIVDPAGRPIYTISAGGIVTQTSYDGAGRILSTTVYANAVVPNLGYTAVTLGAALVADPAHDRTSIFTYNSAGELVQSTDPVGATVSYAYDAIGRKTAYTDKNGGTTTYAYDADGRLLSETDPAVAVTTVQSAADGSLTTQGMTSTLEANVTVFAYDAFGNVSSRTEAAGTSLARTTTYVYDAAGRQVKVIYPAVNIYDPAQDNLAANGMTGSASRTEDTSVSLYSETLYDAFGDAVANRDVAGNYTYKVYNNGAQVIFDVDANGYLTGYVRDGFGQVVTENRYANAPSLGGYTYDNGVFGPGEFTPVQGLVAITRDQIGTNDSSIDRAIHYTYDADGNVVDVTTGGTSGPGAGFYYDSSATAGSQQIWADAETKTSFNAFGEVTQTQKLVNANTQDWAATTSYYDKQGNVVATVDPMGFVTTMQYDAAGNMVSQTQYANASSYADINSVSVPQASAQDRTTTYAYDADNRKISATQVGVTFSSTTDGSTQVGNLTTSYTYDAAGNLTSTTDPTGATTYTYYDALGRVSAIVKPGIAGANGTVVLPLTVYYRDAYGNVVASVGYSQGAASASLAGYTIKGASGGWNGTTLSGADRWTLNEYDTHGNLIEATAGGATTYRSYDAKGELAKQWENVQSADGTMRTDFTAYQYDAVGNLIHVITPASTSVLKTGINGLSFSSAPVVYDEQGTPYVNGTNSVTMAWSSLVNPSGGTVKIIVNYNTLSTSTGVAGGVDESGFPVGGEGSVAASYSDTFGAASLAGGATLSWSNLSSASGGIGSITSVQILQADASGNFQTLWQGTPADAVGSSISTVSQAVAGVDTADMQYDAFGDLTSKGTNAGAQEYFTYDVNGNLIGTNANNGVDELFAYNMQGQQTAVLKSSGNYGDDRSLYYMATDPIGADSEISGFLQNPTNEGYTEDTITVLDKDGNAVQTIEPAGNGYSTTMSLQTSEATYSISSTANGTDESGQPAGVNSVNVSWGQSGISNPFGGSKATPGSGQVKVVMTYTGEINESGASDGTSHTVTQYFSASAVAGGTATLSWLNDDAGVPTGLGSVVSVTVYQQDASGNWAALTDETSSGDATTDAANDAGYLTFAAPGDSSASLSMQVTTADGNTVTLQGEKIGDFVRFNASQLSVGEASAQLFYNAPGQAPAAVWPQGIALSITAPGAGQSVNNVSLDGYVGNYAQSPNIASSPTINRTFDRWGNTTSVSDVRDADWLTTYQYNADNKVVSETTPGASSGAAGGTLQADYDADGREIASRDANGNLTGMVYDGAGDLVKTLQADGGVVTNSYDVFGDKTGTTDALGNRTIMTFDDLGHQSATIAVMPDGTDQVRESATYDALGDKLTDTNGLGETTTYEYDLRGNVISTETPMGQATRNAYDVNGHKVFEVDADNNAATWLYDYFGELEANQDIGGAAYGYLYDAARQLEREENTRGLSLDYTYDGAGHVATIHDNADNETTSYAYDLAGNQVHDEVTKDGVVYQDEYLSYDADNRLRQVQDGNVSITTDYDANGNRTHVEASYLDGSGTNEDLYFGYNNMNQETVADAVDSNLDISATQGHVLTYDLDGNRTSDVHGGKEYDAQGNAITGLVTEQYSYDSLNRLSQTTYNGVVTDHRTYDAGDHVLTSGADGSVGQAYFDGLGIAADRQTNTYNADGQELTVIDSDASGNEKYALNYDSYDAVGNVLEYTQTVPGSGGYTNTYDYDMVRFAGYQVADIRGTSTKFSSGETSYQYDANGNLVGITDSTDSANNRTFVNDSNGMILRKTQGSNIENEMIVNGQIVATTGTGADSSSGSSPTFVNVSNFDPSYQSVSNSFPAAAPGEYTVQGGDTLQSIAQSAYGDSNLWYLIADANGLTSNSDMRVGQTLTIPNRVTDVHNNATTYRPYSASSIVGNTSPNLAPPSDGGGGCGIVGAVIVEVVAAVAAFYTGQYELLDVGLSEFGASAVAGVVGSATGQLLGDAVGTHQGFSLTELGESVAGSEFGTIGQVASKAVFTGKIDLTDIATAAADAGITYASDGFISNDTPWGAAALDAVNQEIRVATGDQKRFNWAETAGAALRGGLTSGTNDAQGQGQGYGFTVGNSDFGVGSTIAPIGDGSSVLFGPNGDTGNLGGGDWGGQTFNDVAEPEPLPFYPDSAGAYAEVPLSASALSQGQPFQYQSDPEYPISGLYAQNGESDVNGGSFVTRTGDGPTGVFAPVSPDSAEPLATSPGLPGGVYGIGYDGAFSGYTANPNYSSAVDLGATQFRGDVTFSDGAAGFDSIGSGSNFGGLDGHDLRVAQLQSMAPGVSSGYNADGTYNILVTQTPPDAPISSGAPTAAPTSDWDTLTQQKNAQVANGTYDAFSALGHAIADPGSLGERLERFANAATYTRPDAQQQISRMFPAPSVGAATLSNMLASPVASIYAGATILSGGTPQQAYQASQLGVATEGTLAGAAGIRIPQSPRLSSLASPGIVPNTGAVAEVGAADSVIPSKLYHYTNDAGMSGILDSESLNPSLKSLNPNDVRYGNGQYLSDFEPGTMTPAQLSRAFINNPFQGARYTNFVEIDTTGLNVVQGRPGVYVVPNEVPLDLSGRITNSGKVLGQ